MIKLKVAAVAFATGMMTIAVYAQDQMPENPKSLAEKASKKQKEKSETAGKPGVDTNNIHAAPRFLQRSSPSTGATGPAGGGEQCAQCQRQGPSSTMPALSQRARPPQY